MAWRRTARALPGGFVHVHDHRVQLGALPRRLHAHRQAGEEALQDDVRLDADHRIVGPGHAAIGLVGRAARQDARVGGGHVGVRADHRGNAAVQVPAHGDLLAGDLGVKIDEPHLDRRVELGQDLVGLAERAIGGRHVGAALQIDHGALHAVARAQHDHAAARRVGVVGRPQQPRLAVQVIVELALVPDVIAGGEHIQPHGEQLFGDGRSDAEAAGGVLRVGDGQVDVVGLDDVLQVVGDNPASRRGENIADKENVHSWIHVNTYAARNGPGTASIRIETLYNPQMQRKPWSTIALGSLLLISACSKGGQEVQSPQPEKSKPPVKMEQRGRILGIGGIFFKSANRDQMREWYSKHLGLADKGQGAMLPWREHDDPQKEHVTVWTVFPASTKYLDPSPAPFMINYIVDDMDALLDRLKQEGVKIDAKRMDESYGRFAWIYDLDGNKIELWQPSAKP